MRGGGSRSSLRAAVKRLGEIVAAGRRQADRARGIGDGFRTQALLGAWHRHRDQAAREPGEIAQEPFAILACQHSDDQHQRPRHTLLQIGQRRGNRAAPVRIVPAVEPQFAAGRRERDELAMRQPLQPRRPLGLDHAGLVGGGAILNCGDRAQRGNRQAGILELMAAVEFRRRQIEQARFVLIDQPATLLGRGPVLAGDLAAARSSLAACRSITASASRCCAATIAGTPRLRMPAFSAAILSSVSPRNSVWSIEIGVMTVASGCSITLVASSRPPRPTSSSSTSAGWRANSSRPAAVVISNTVIGAPALARSHSSSAAANSSSRHRCLRRRAEPEALVEAHQMRRGIGVHALARGFQDRAQERDGRALAVGAGDMDHRRQFALGMIERGEQPLHAIERQVDALGMQRDQPRDDGVDGGHAVRSVITGRRASAVTR